MIASRLFVIVVCHALLVSSLSAQQRGIDLAQFDSWIFRTTRTESAAREVLRSEIELQISRIERTVELKEFQKERIRLAGKGDIKRFFDRVEKARAVFRALGTDFNQNNINEAYQLTVPLQQELSNGLFKEDSLLKKVLSASLNEQQSETIREEAERRAKLQTESSVKMWIAQLGRKVPMTNEQREAFYELACQHVQPIRGNKQYTTYFIAYQMSRLPREKLEAILDEAQWKAVKTTLIQAESWRAMLKQQGMLDEQ